MLLLQRGHLVRNQRRSISRGVDARSFFGRFERKSSVKFNRSFDLCSFGVAESVLFFQLGKWRTMQSGQPAEFAEQALSNRDRVLALHANTHKDGDQFSVGQSLGP